MVRVSGPHAFGVSSAVFRTATRSERPWRPRRALVGWVVHPASGQTLDQAVLLPFRGPASYTGEDVVEITCHGGPVPLRQVVGALLAAGARLAEPGEFTRRAFLNGKLDLAQAEAVMDAIAAQSASALTVAVSQLEGKLSAQLAPARRELLDLRAALEAAIDFPEEIEEPPPAEIRAPLEKVRSTLDGLLASAESGRLYREGAAVVIAGKPNVGKSTLMNALLRDARAIVTEIPGTTRDVLEEPLSLDGIPIRLLDTAGLRESEDPVERIGIDRARRSIEAADLVVVLLDRSRPLSTEDAAVLEAAGDRKRLVVVNKTDLEPSWGGAELEGLLGGSGGPVVETSLAAEQGHLAVEEALRALLAEGLVAPGEVRVSSLRHRSALERALESVSAAAMTVETGMPLDLVAGDLRAAAEELGQVTGESVTEAMVEEIFSRFCVGK